MVTDLQSRRFAFDTTRRYTLEEYHRLVEDGILEEDARVELLEGRIVAMSPIRPRHQRIVTKLFKTFTRQERGRFVAEQDCPLPIPDHDEPEPDLVLYRPGAADEQRHVRPADVLLVVEVAQSTRRRDPVKKAGIYEGAKILEYWVVDLKRDGLHVFTLVGERYETRIVREGKLSPQALPGIEVDVGTLFGGA
ncbi:MAG: Uma2 family endonuclease [Verrucomicrobia bacterium]|nr:Uma2 family endonuclease [Verrucomicrobiota bacterium]